MLFKVKVIAGSSGSLLDSAQFAHRPDSNPEQKFYTLVGSSRCQKNAGSGLKMCLLSPLPQMLLFLQGTVLVEKLIIMINLKHDVINDLEPDFGDLLTDEVFG